MFSPLLCYVPLPLFSWLSPVVTHPCLPHRPVFPLRYIAEEASLPISLWFLILRNSLHPSFHFNVMLIRPRNKQIDHDMTMALNSIHHMDENLKKKTIQPAKSHYLCPPYTAQQPPSQPHHYNPIVNEMNSEKRNKNVPIWLL